jgi:hypothetical protein
VSSTEVTQLLERWEARLRDLGAPCVDHLRPGLTRGQVDASAAEHGLRVCDDVAALWMWHDGDTPLEDRRGLTPGGQFRTVQSSLEHSQRLVHLTCDGDDDGDHSDELPGVELRFRRDFLTILVHENPLYVDCTPGATGTATGFFISHDAARAPRVELADRLHHWHDALDRGLWRIDADGAWVVDDAAAPDEPLWWWLY